MSVILTGGVSENIEKIAARGRNLVPTKGVKTLYSITGDLFGWLAVATFLGMIAFSKKPQSR